MDKRNIKFEKLVTPAWRKKNINCDRHPDALLVCCTAPLSTRPDAMCQGIKLWTKG